MSASMWCVFLAASLLTAFSPGPGVLLAISNAASMGPKSTIYSSAGNALGVFTVACLSACGLGAVLRAAPAAFMALRIAGALYLVYLGIRQWRTGSSVLAAAARPARSRLVVFRQGYLVAVGNPKSILFFAALFSQFAKPGAIDLALFAVLTCTFIGATLASHLVYVLAVARTRDALSAPAGQLALRVVSGSFFMVLGIAMLFGPRAG